MHKTFSNVLQSVFIQYKVCGLYFTKVVPSGDWPTPTSVRTKMLSPRTAWLGWKDPSLGQAQEITDDRYYNVQYRITAFNGKLLSIIVKDLQVILHDLVPGTWYEFKVRTVKDGQTSSFSEMVVNKTMNAGMCACEYSL